MSLPTNRQEVKKWCLRKLGAPVIEINVSDEQVDDRIDEALQYFYNVHMDGSEKTYYKYEIQAQDIANKYITLPDNIIGAVNLFPVGQSYSTNNLFNIRYQLILNDLFSLNNIEIVPYYVAMMHVAQIEEIFVGQQPMRYDKYNNRLYIDTDWSLLEPGNFIVVEAYQVVDAEEFTKVWSDRWLLRYITALIKENWGEILSKYQDMPTAGGLTLNWQAIKAEAKDEITALEKELIETYSIPSTMFIG